MLRLNIFPESRLVAVTRASTSSAFLSLNTAVTAYVPMYKNVKYSKNNLLKAHVRASSEIQDSSSRGTDLEFHGVSRTVVGVVGGGQLGGMLCEAASELAIQVIVLDPMENCPASDLCHYHMVGSYDDSSTAEEFAKRCGVLTMAIEHVDAAVLEKLEHQGVDCQPKASTIRIIQDKYLQKVHFFQHAIPMPKFMQIDDLEGAKTAADLFGYPLMIKSRRRGKAVAKNEAEISLAVNALGGYARGLYVEKWVPFVEELCVIVARGRDNTVLCYAVVETFQRENICHVVKSPADVPWKIQKLATEVAEKAVSSLEGAGVFAVELFLTADDQVLLNEVAAGPHNSGHHTMESCYTSQYEQHLRAVVGLPLGDPSMKFPGFIMYSKLGEDEGEPSFHAYQLIGKRLKISGAVIHWYDKPELGKQRKMGRITYIEPSMGSEETKLQSVLKEDQPAVAPRVGIIMGSDSDLPVMKDAAIFLRKLDVPFEVRIISAHRTPEVMMSYAKSARKRGIQVIVAGAGGAAHLPGTVAASTSVPVIGVPIRVPPSDGLDALLSIVQMPKGVPVATVGINNATNAGVLSVMFLAMRDVELQARLDEYQKEIGDEVLMKNAKLEQVGWEAYLDSYLNREDS